MTVRRQKPQEKKKRGWRRLEKSNKPLGRDNNKMMQTVRPETKHFCIVY